MNAGDSSSRGGPGGMNIGDESTKLSRKTGMTAEDSNDGPNRTNMKGISSDGFPHSHLSFCLAPE